MPGSWWRSGSQACPEPHTSLPVCSGRRLFRSRRASGLRLAVSHQCPSCQVCLPSCTRGSSGILHVALPTAPEEALGRGVIPQHALLDPSIGCSPFADLSQHLPIKSLHFHCLEDPTTKSTSNPACTSTRRSPTLSRLPRPAPHARSAATTLKPCECRRELCAALLCGTGRALLATGG